MFFISSAYRLCSRLCKWTPSKSSSLSHSSSPFKLRTATSSSSWKYFCKHKLMIVRWISYPSTDIPLGRYLLKSRPTVTCSRSGISRNVFTRRAISLTIWKGSLWKLMSFSPIWTYILLGLVWIILCVVLWSRICLDVPPLSPKKCTDESVISRTGWFEIRAIKLCPKRAKVMVI